MSDEFRRELIEFLVQEGTGSPVVDADLLLGRYVISPRNSLNSQCQAVTLRGYQCYTRAKDEYDGVGLCGMHANMHEAGRPIHLVTGAQL